MTQKHSINRKLKICSQYTLAIALAPYLQVALVVVLVIFSLLWKVSSRRIYGLDDTVSLLSLANFIAIPSISVIGSAIAGTYIFPREDVVQPVTYELILALTIVLALGYFAASAVEKHVAGDTPFVFDREAQVQVAINETRRLLVDTYERAQKVAYSKEAVAAFNCGKKSAEHSSRGRLDQLEKVLADFRPLPNSWRQGLPYSLTAASVVLYTFGSDLAILDHWLIPLIWVLSTWSCRELYRQCIRTAYFLTSLTLHARLLVLSRRQKSAIDPEATHRARWKGILAGLLNKNARNHQTATTATPASQNKSVD